MFHVTGLLASLLEAKVGGLSLHVGVEGIYPNKDIRSNFTRATDKNCLFTFICMNDDNYAVA